MVINTSMTGSSGTPLATSAQRTGPGSKTASPSNTPSDSTDFAGVSAPLNARFGADASDFEDGAAIGKSMQFARMSILTNPGAAMLAQANFSRESAMTLLRE